MFFLGIDPGIKGGISGLDMARGILWSVEMPVRPIIDKKAKKFEYDITRIAALLRACKPDRICLEAVHSMPGQGVSSTFLFGKGFGILLGVIGALGLPCELVSPRVWKKKLEITADKETSRIKASELFPNCADLWKLKKHDGLAEAALLSYYIAGIPDLDIVVSGDIFKLYHIEVNSSAKTRHSRRHHNITKSPENDRPRNRENRCDDPGAGGPETIGN